MIHRQLLEGCLNYLKAPSATCSAVTLVLRGIKRGRTLGCPRAAPIYAHNTESTQSVLQWSLDSGVCDVFFSINSLSYRTGNNYVWARESPHVHRPLLFWIKLHLKLHVELHIERHAFLSPIGVGTQMTVRHLGLVKRLPDRKPTLLS